MTDVFIELAIPIAFFCIVIYVTQTVIEKIQRKKERQRRYDERHKLLEHRRAALRMHELIYGGNEDDNTNI